MTTVDFGSQVRLGTGRQRIWLREVWSQAWVFYEDIHCLDATWALSPTMPTATLVYDYGHVKGYGERAYLQYDKLEVNGYYVRIGFEVDIDPDNLASGKWIYWYGVVQHIEDNAGGIITFNDVPLATGSQTLHCYGMEKLLDTEYIAESYVDWDDEAAGVVQLPICFNHWGRPNRNDRLMEPQGGYCFEGRTLSPGGTLRPTAQWWTTNTIVEYLLRFMVPKDSFRTRASRIQYQLYEAGWLPTEDQPVIEQENQTVLAILNRLIDRRRLRSFYTDVDESVSPAVVRLHIVAWNDDIIDSGIDGADVLQANEDIITLLYDYSPNTNAILRKTKTATYDRIVVRGARRTTTATFHVATNFFEPAWLAATETAYEAGASGWTAYASLDLLTQMQMNAEARSASKLDAVYCWFKIPDAWDQSIIEPTTSSAWAAFKEDDGPMAPQDIHEITIEPQLPLYEGVDYSDDVIANNTAADPPLFTYRQPFLVFKTPTDNRWVAGDAIGTLAESTSDPDDDSYDGRNWRWSAMPRVQPDSRTMEIRVSGEQQHVIAATDFTPLAEDRDLGNFDYRSKKMLLTMTVLDNRYAEGKYPEDGANDGTLIDQQFGFIIYAGPEYRQDYVVPMTVVDVGDNGTLKQSTNGGYVRDDTALLNALARVAYEWWSQERTVLSVTTPRLTADIWVGKMIDTIGDSAVTRGNYEIVNTVISETRIMWPRLEGNQVDGPTLEFITGAGELDPMTLMPPRRKILGRAQAKRATV
jgi:hypothetical protein